MGNRKLVETNEIKPEQKHSTLVRVISAIVIIAIALPCTFLGDYFFFAFILIVGFLGCYEVSKCVSAKYKILLTVLSVLIVGAMACWPIFGKFFSSDPIYATDIYRIYINYDSIYLSVIGVALIGLIAMFIVICDTDFSVKDACVYFLLLILLALAMESILYLRYFPQYEKYMIFGEAFESSYFNVYDSLASCTLVLYVFLADYLTDAGAYFFGMLFGKNKLNERISPKKTWEGFIGGYATSFIISFLFAFILAICDNPICSALDSSHWYLILILSLIIPLFAVLGDFIFSSIKRAYEIKDFSNIIPGHGGVLDRIDSLVVSLIVSALFICIASGIINGTLGTLFV
ncbi:MAG: phosphatidate cytidylyltransferase [Coprobacillus sp.]|nr:phosphatidate cytidylyltransferase [Coprobacillus sp.]